MKMTTLPTHLRQSGNARLVSIFLAVLIYCLPAIASATTYQKELQIDFSFDTTAVSNKTVSGYRLYKENVLLCTTGPVSPQTMTCSDSGQLGTTYSFNLAAFYNDGTESPKSPVFPFSVGNTGTFTWEYTATATPISGFKIYQNDNLVCQTSDTTSRQLACGIVLASANVFRITAVANDSSEINLPTSSVAITGGTTTPSDPLNAVIVTTSQTGQAPFNLSLDGSKSTGAISSYSWTFGDGSVATGATTAHTYPAAGTYTATLTIADAGGQTRQSNMTISVTAVAPPPKTPPVVSLSSSTAVGAAPFAVQFDGSGSTSAQPPIVSYIWDFGDGTSAEGAVVSHTFTTAGTYQTTLTVTDIAGMYNHATTPVLITTPPAVENKKPLAAFTATPKTGTAPLKVSLNGATSSDPDGSIASYLWTFGDGSTASGVSAEHTFSEIADYTVTLQVTDNKGATAVASQTISVHADLLYTDNENEGFWQWSSTGWQQISTINPTNIVATGKFAYATDANGLWEWNGNTWRKINSIAPTNMVASGTALYANFPGYGLYKWEGGVYTKLNSVISTSMAISGSTLYANFTGYGLYSWNGSAWTRLNTQISTSMVASGSTLYANFTGYGLYFWNGSAWIRMNTQISTSMVASDSTLYANFTGYGLYSWNGSTWVRMNTLIPTSMVASSSTLYANFTGYGLYSWSGSAWTRLNTLIPAGMVASGSIVYANYPAYGGLWKCDVETGAWSFLTGGPGTPPVKITSGY